jgi:hypothetical protein
VTNAPLSTPKWPLHPNGLLDLSFSAGIFLDESDLDSVSADSGTSKFTFTGGDPVALGMNVGQTMRFTRLSEAANNSRSFTIVSFGGTNNREVTVTPAPATMGADSDFGLRVRRSGNVPPVPPLASGDLGFTNLNFETGNMTGWTANGWSARTVGSGFPAAYEGTYYAQGQSGNISTATQEYTFSSDELASIQGGRQYVRLSWWFRGGNLSDPDVDDVGNVFLQFYDASNVLVGTIGSFSHYGPNNLWAQGEFDGLVPTTAVKARINMSRVTVGGASADYYVDDIRISWSDEPLPTPAEPGFLNLGAESGTLHWEPVTNYMASGNWGGTYSPQSGLNYFRGASFTAIEARQTVEIPASRHAAIDAETQDISFSFYERFFGTDQGQLLLQFLASDNSVLGSLGPTLGNRVAAWTLKSYSGTIPANTRKLRLYYNAVRVASPELDYYVDTISVSYT